MENKVYMINFSFEMTRRCNLACRWCSRGNAQDVDITKEIIDKALDEIAPFYLYAIQITGGEPFMNSDMVLYLAQQIVKRHIKVRSIYIPTNGTIKNDTVKEALTLLADYLFNTREQDWRKDIEQIFSERIETEYNYPDAVGKDILVACSVDEHDNKDTIDEVCGYYNIDKENYIIQTQDDNIYSRKGIDTGVIMEGRMLETYPTWSRKELNIVRIIHNKYCIIRDDFKEDAVAIIKSLSVSANSNVYVGCMRSYENVDKEPMFNIKGCNGDFYQKVDEWCWENPISPTAEKFMEKYLSVQWQKKHGIPISVQGEHTFGAVAERIKIYKRQLKAQHSIYPFLNHFELNMLAVMKLCLRFQNPDEQFVFLRVCANLDEESIATLDLGRITAICDELKERNEARRNAASQKER